MDAAFQCEGARLLLESREATVLSVNREPMSAMGLLRFSASVWRLRHRLDF